MTTDLLHETIGSESEPIEERRNKCRHCTKPIVLLMKSPTKYIPVDAATVRRGQIHFDPKKGHVSHFESCLFTKKGKIKE